jgi:voltage-gated potassium channel
MRKPIQRVVLGSTALGIVVVLGILGYVVTGWTLLEALYMVVITISGVGYKEVRPDMSSVQRIWTMLIIVFGLTAAVYTGGGVIQLVAEGEVNRALGHRRRARQIGRVSQHIVICGFGRMGTLLCADLQDNGAAFVLIDRDPERIEEAERLGYLYVEQDATEEQSLTAAGIERAAALVTVLPSDAENVFITLTARALNQRIQIISRAELPSTQKKLLQAGADRVVLPAAIGAQRISTLLTRPAAFELTELVTGRQSVDLEMAELAIPDGCPLCESTLAAAEVRKRTGVIVVAFKRPDGTLVFNPESDIPMHAGDSVVVLGRHEQVDRFRQAFQV